MPKSWGHSSHPVLSFDFNRYFFSHLPHRNQLANIYILFLFCVTFNISDLVGAFCAMYSQ